jgi:hypothetical protein
LLTVGSAVAVRADEPLAVPRRMAAAVDEYQQLARGQQSVWLGNLFAQRSQPACRIAYAPAEVQRQQRRQQAVLAKLRTGRELSNAGLVRLLSEVDAHERAAIGRLWRDFEFSTAQAFHQQRGEFEKRMDARRAMSKRWQDAGQPWQQQPALIGWLQASVAAQQQIPRLALPAIPSFSSASESKLAGVELRAAADTAPANPKQPAGAAPPPPARAASGRFVTRPLQPAAARSPAEVRVDLGELQARSTAYNLSLANLVAQLHEQDNWSAERLDAAVDALAELQTLRGELQLYRDVLTAATRRNLPAMTSTVTAFSLLGARTAAARRRLEDAGHRATSAQDELVRLERISRRLAQLATDAEQ